MPLPHDFSQPVVRRSWLRQLKGAMTDSQWNEMVRDLFAWQFARVPAYARLCVAHGVTPDTLKSWREIPAVPQQLFKLTMLYAHELRTPEAIYVTSGTTTGQPGRQHLLHTDVYRAVCIEGACRAGLFDQADLEMHFLVPSPVEAPFSSLSAMFGFWQKEFRSRNSCFWVRDGHFAFAKLRETLLARIKTRRPIAICGTAFSFVHLMDAWADLPPLKLPRGSWLLETGGFKGRSREVSKMELYTEMGRIFGVGDDSIWNEYGMSELSSQAYARGSNGLHQTPPWARVMVCHPATGREVAIGQKGLIRWIDLANTDSVLALQTLDLAERTTKGFRLIGRMARTEPRGCSLSADDIAARQFAAMP